MSNTDGGFGAGPVFFRDIATQVTEKYIPRSTDVITKCVNLEHLIEGSGRISGHSKASDNLSIKTSFRCGDILFGKLRPYLRKYAQPSFDGVCTTEILAFRAKENVDPGFLFQVVGSDAFIDHNVAVSYGTKMPRTDWRTAGDFLLFLPTPDEQRLIAEVLSTLDEQIEQTEALIAKYQSCAIGLMQDLLPEGFNLDKLPDGKLSDALLGIEGGKSFMCSDRPATQGSWGVLKVSAVRPDGFVNTENKSVENLNLVAPRYEVKHADLLITRANTPELVGAACLVENPQSRLLLCDKTLRMQPNSAAFPVYLWLWLQTPVARRHVDAHATGTSAGMKNIGQQAIRSIPLALPSLEEQRERVAPVVAQIEYLRELRTEVAKLRLKKQGLMRDLLTGKGRVITRNELQSCGVEIFSAR